MAEKAEDMIAILNGLIETCKNGEKGFREAADSLQNAQYQSFFQEYARIRNKFARDLQGHVRILGGNPDRKGTFTGTIHRGWMNLRLALKKGDKVIVAECKRGEEAALKNYEEALTKDLPENLRILVEKHCQEIKETCRRLAVM